MTEYLNVGKIVNTQGIKGEVRVISQTDFPELRYQTGNTLTLFQADKQPIKLTVKSHRKHKNFDLLSFEGHYSINDVEKYRDGILKVEKSDGSELPENEYYYHQIIGLAVITTTGETIGRIKEILSPGANDVWVIARSGKKDALIPYIESVVKAIDLDENTVTIELMEGLIDEN
ncbi:MULTISPECIES: ribosome maturation factor RimM [unclassified Enterococcus]|uniref:ribosome maturation factor RimM n=1 Tax=unclassified Enterococcus TaxID=2608891 RepID=UPI0015539DF7|nr:MULTISPECIES: ribosome maturation factor RimM [unclassified Enterococcus]MBS7577594.1 ribosome maturation factor RimM [Enterococcus sp. MMGLQ5-2]MBS7584907.1 ribosome maturation factor RimM [Enterococcus sp. MMGLQ5-1]NPD12762.1 ribosome maturation factor RimM [Enterococcus sp. MMGLQ5-1]NPD37427.1 ribosome maturation factor RimM [Enterococcus sp. MMGLQ5-2]